MQIIDGKAIAEKIKDNLVKEILKLNGARPNLAIILVGEREDSKLYVSLKEIEAKRVGIDTHVYKCPENVSDSELLDMVKFLNEDNSIDAILVQLPLPGHLDTDGIILAINPDKDVDGFHPKNLESLYDKDEKNKIIPPVFDVVLEIFKNINYDLKNKKISIVANSDIFGQGLARFLGLHDAIATFLKPDQENMAGQLLAADIIVTAVGRPNYIKKEMVKKDSVLIDVGICKDNGKTCGDIDFDDVDGKAGFITPVPGGVGPMTIAMAFKNTLELYKRRHAEVRSQK